MKRALLLGLAMASFLVASRVDAAIIERVVAVVNDEAILLSDVRRRAVPFLEQAMGALGEDERMNRVRKLYREVLDRLIDESLIKQTADEMQVTVTKQDEDRAIQNVQAQSGLSDPDFWEAVRAQGFTQAEYRHDVHRQLLRLKVLNQKVRGRVNITEAEVRQKYEDAIRQARRTERFRVSHIFLAIPENASPAQVGAIRNEAAAVRKQATASNFADLITKHGGGDLGWLKQGDLPETLERTLLTMTAGAIGEPVRGPSGFHIFLLHERQQGIQQIPAFTEVRERIYRGLIEQAMARQEKIFLEELRREAVIDRRL